MKTNIWIQQEGLSVKMCVDMNRSFTSKVIRLILRCSLWVEKKEVIIVPIILPIIKDSQPLAGVSINEKRRKEILRNGF